MKTDKETPFLGPVGEQALFLCTLVLGIFYFAWLGDRQFTRRSLPIPASTEAEIALAAIHGQERSYFSEFARYTQSFPRIGWAADANRRLYAVGFPAECREKEGVAPEQSFVPTALSPYAEGREREILEFFGTVRRRAECKNLDGGFEAFAVGFLSKNGPPDIWRIDEKKHLEHLPGPARSTPFLDSALAALSGLIPIPLFLAGLLFLLGPYHLRLNITARGRPGATLLASFLTGAYYCLLFVILLGCLFAPTW